MTALRNLGSILVRPRQTMRRILDQPRDRMGLGLVVLATLSAGLGDLEPGSLRDAFRTTTPGEVLLVVIGINLGVILITLLFYYGLAAAALVIGRLFEGQGTARDLRRALAWGVAPGVWALLYRLPAVLFMNRSSKRFGVGDATVQVTGFDFSNLGLGCALALLELAVLAWFLVVTSLTIAEAHRFSGGRGFATLLITLAAPIIVTAAAVLAFLT